jgi:2-polyprenyl-3-methyl-5-hydroxy-6-metoxy-1,4-benzoquinol methylase
VKVGLISDPSFPNVGFDAVGMLHVLGHMYDPIVSVTRCPRLLKPAGVLVVKSPNGFMQRRKERVKKLLG